MKKIISIIAIISILTTMSTATTFAASSAKRAPSTPMCDFYCSDFYGPFTGLKSPLHYENCPSCYSYDYNVIKYIDCCNWITSEGFKNYDAELRVCKNCTAKYKGPKFLVSTYNPLSYFWN